MKAIRILSVFLISLGLALSAFASGPGGNASPKPAKSAQKQEDKSEKRAFKQQLKSQRAECREHPNSAGCSDLKHRQKIEKRAFKADEKAEKNDSKKAN
jgi:hypothetical protein